MVETAGRVVETAGRVVPPVVTGVEGCVPLVIAGPCVVLGWMPVVPSVDTVVLVLTVVLGWTLVVPGPSVLTVVPSVETVLTGALVSELTTEVMVLGCGPLSAV